MFNILAWAIFAGLLAVNVSVSAQVSILQPSASTTIAKRGNRVCAGLGNGAVEFDASKNNDFRMVNISSGVKNIFSIGENAWGIISPSGIYQWTPDKKELVLLRADDFGVSRGAYYRGKIYLAKRDTIFSLSNDGSLSKFATISGNTKGIGFIGDAMIVFGNGTNIIPLSEPKKVTRAFQEYWAEDGVVNPKAGEFVVGGGGWPGVVVKWPSNGDIKVLDRKLHSTYDTISGWDVDSEGNYWLFSKLAGEAAVDDGRNLFQSYPAQVIIYPPTVMLDVFIAAAGNLFMPTEHGILKIRVDTGEISLLAYPPVVKTYFERTKEDLALRARFTSSLRVADGTWFGGEIFGGHWGKQSFLLFDGKTGTAFYDVPLKGLRRIAQYKGQLLLAGHLTDTWEGMGMKESGGLATFDPKTHDFKLLYTEPVSAIRVLGDKVLLEAYLSLGDDSGCYRDVASVYALSPWQENSSTSTVICSGSDGPYEKGEDFVVDAKKAADIRTARRGPFAVDGPTVHNNAPMFFSLGIKANIGTEPMQLIPTTFDDPRAALKQDQH